MSNKLSQSTSPYLLQHADNPVHWQEWGEAALADARAGGKPILLSIGYSACHWCHVMAHESFEDEGIAAVMNALFVNIKVDREERPDLDQIYQSAHAMLTQRSGGWPLTMFLTPDTTPFFGGTYFPKQPRYGLPGFGDLLKRVAAYHRDRGPDIAEQNGRLVAALRATASGDAPASGDVPPPDVLQQAWREMQGSFDPEWGGFGRAPKFPHPEMIEFCLRHHAATGDEDARHVASHTLERMCRGGLYDQLGGGFARYSVDEEWAIPHFEKMLYDNGPLLRLLADAALAEPDASRRALFERCARGTAEWVCREMQSPAGGYYSTLDADSEGHEGKFYVWDRDAARSLLDAHEWAAAAPHFGLDGAPNFEGEAWHLLGLDDAGVPAIASARDKLLAARGRRVRPGRDEKILVSWNALMIEGMARAAIAFDSPDWLASARRALDFLRREMWDGSRARLFATHKDGVSRLNAYLDDYAFLLKAVLAMLEADFRADEFAFGRQLADALLEHFQDDVSGGFFFTSHDHEKLLQRTKPGFDNATPSGNGVAAFALQRWHHLTHDPRYDAAARRTLAGFAGSIIARPSAHGSLLMALDEHHVPPSLLILQGEATATAGWRRQLVGYRPRLMVLRPVGEVPAALSRPPAEAVQGWLCHGTTCLPPIGRVEELLAAL